MKFFNKIMLIVAAAATMVACQKEETFAPSKSVKLTVNAEAEALQNDTRTYIDNTNTILWGAEESMTVSCYDVAAASSHFATATTTEYADQSKASFTFEFTGLNAESTNFVLGGVYPTAACVSSDLVSAFKVSLPAKQSATANSYDPAAYIMVAQPVEVSTLPESLMMTYRRATALNKVTLTGIDDDIVSVTITAPEDVVLAGRRYFNLTEGTANEIYYGQTNEVTVSYNEALVGGYDMDVWFTSWESSIAEGAELTICAKSETTSYTRTITANANGISFKEGFLNLLTVNMAADDVVVETVASYEGNYVAAVKVDGTYYALSVEANGTRQAAVALDSWNVVNDIYFTEDTNIQWAIEKTEAGYTMLNGTKYIYYAGSENVASTSTDPYYLTIEASATEGAVKIASKNIATRLLQYNKDQKYFAFYTSNQVSDFYLLKPMADTRTPLATPNIITAQVVDKNNITVSWKAVENAASYTVTCGSESVNTTETTHTFTVAQGLSYEISVIAHPAEGSTLYSDSEAATTTIEIPAASNAILTETFDDITSGNSTGTSGSGSAWAGNTNFPTVSTAYQAGGAVRIGSSKASGSITSKELDLSTAFTVSIAVKGWTAVEGSLTVTVGDQVKTIAYTEVMADDFGVYTVEFDAATAASTITIATTAKRAFIDSVIVSAK